MKKVLLFLAFMQFVFVPLCPAANDASAGAIITQKDKQGKISNAKIPGMDLMTLYIRQKKMTDSLCEVVLVLQKRLSIVDLELGSNDHTSAQLQEHIDGIKAKAQNHMIYIIILFSILMLLSIILLSNVWYKHNRRLNNLLEDQEKTNEALNLHIKNTSEEIAALNEMIEGLQKKS